jgi:hypothetical protein
MELLGERVYQRLAIVDIKFPKMVMPFYTPINKVSECQVSILDILMGCDGISMVFHFTFPTLLHMLNIFSCAYNYVNMFFCRVPILVFCPLFFVILYWLLFIHSKNKSSVRYIHVSFSQCMAYLFTLWMVSLVMSRS